MQRFIISALDPEHGCPAYEALLLVERLDDLRAILGQEADSDPELRRGYSLYAAELDAIAEKFGVRFDPEGRDVELWKWHSLRELPYLVHTGFELALMLDGRKPRAHFSDTDASGRHHNEDRFDRYVEHGEIQKTIIAEALDSSHAANGVTATQIRRVFYSLKGEEWRIPAYQLMRATAARTGWNEVLERLEGSLLGYEDWQNDLWIERYHRR